MSGTPLISAETIQTRVVELAGMLSQRYAGREVLLLIALKGGIVFGADLMRHMQTPVLIDFIRARSYQGTESSGKVTLSCVPEIPLADRDVVIVEDILDTGRTSFAIREWVRVQKPASVALCVLLDKPARRCIPIEADFTGFTIDDAFVVGYGLDYDQRGRQCPDIIVLDDTAVAKRAQ